MARLITLARIAVAGFLTAMAGTAPAQQPREVAIGLSSASFATAPGRLAQSLGIFEKHGLKPRFVTLDSGSGAVAALISRSIDVALAGSGEWVAAQSRGQKIVAIANIYAGSGGTVVLAKATMDKLGLSPQTPVKDRLKALDTLTFASPSAPSAYTVTLKKSAESAGATVRFTYMAQPAMSAALESGAIQGYISSAPFWALPVVRGTGVAWLSTADGDVPAEYMPKSAISLQSLRASVEADPELTRKLRAVFAEFVETVRQRPAEVKAAAAKLYPDLDARTLDLLFETEAKGWMARPLTTEDAAHEIAFVKMSGVPLPQIDQVDPAAMIVP